MRYFVSFLAIAMLGVLALTACNSAEQKATKSSSLAKASPAQTVPSDGARRVTTVELKDLLDRNKAVVIDVRNDASYNQSHIKGAKLIPEAEVAKRSDELPKDKLIVTYCS
jgi:predicted sulfurtransferase